jgi:hypothetical protein
MNSIFKRPISVINKLSYALFNKNQVKTQSLIFSYKPVRLNQTQNSAYSSEIAYMTKLAEENKTKNILVYSCISSGSVRVNLLGILGLLFLGSSSYFSWLVFGTFKQQNTRRDESGFFGKILNIMASDYFRHSVCFAMAGVGVAMFAVSLATTARAVNKIYLLKGGKSLGVITDGIFGKTLQYNFRLDETSFNQTRLMPDKRVPHIWFKNKKHFFYFLINNIEGEYHEKFLFDRVICAKRWD